MELSLPSREIAMWHGVTKDGSEPVCVGVGGAGGPLGKAPDPISRSRETHALDSAKMELSMPKHGWGIVLKFVADSQNVGMFVVE